MKKPTSRHFAVAMLAGLFILLALFATCCLGGCDTLREDTADAASNVRQTASNYDRDYSATYDVSTNSYTAGVTIRPAQRPGAGSPSLSLGVRGNGKEIVR